MKNELIQVYTEQKRVFLEEKKAANETLDFINNQMKIIETEMAHCSGMIKKEKENIAFHQEHLTFKSPVEIELSLKAIKQYQETLLTMGEMAFSFQGSIQDALETLKQTERGILLCEECLEKLQTFNNATHEQALGELKTIFQES